MVEALSINPKKEGYRWFLKFFSTSNNIHSLYYLRY